jgi:erythromycin esterase
VVAQVADSRFVCLGEASHGTSEFYRWRALLSRRLIETQEIGWIGVEGDWPDCWQLNQWVCGREHLDLDVVSLLSRFERWPTWMWANREVADFLSWLREWNRTRPASGADRFLRPGRVLPVGLPASGHVLAEGQRA